MIRVAVEGTEVACDYSANDAATRSIVFVHGWMDAMGDTDRNAPALAEQFTVLRFDLPGHGASAPLGHYSFETYVQASIAALAQFDLPDPILVGHSMGAMVVTEMHRRQPHRWPVVVLLDPPLRGSNLVRFWQPFVLAGRATGVLGWAVDRLRARKRLVSWWCDTFDGVESDATRWARFRTAAAIRAADRRAIADGLVDIAANRMVLGPPPGSGRFFIVFGVDDPTIDRVKVSRWFSPDQIFEIPGTRHTPNRVDPAAVNDVLVRIAST